MDKSFHKQIEIVLLQAPVNALLLDLHRQALAMPEKRMSIFSTIRINTRDHRENNMNCVLVDLETYTDAGIERVIREILPETIVSPQTIRGVFDGIETSGHSRLPVVVILSVDDHLYVDLIADVSVFFTKSLDQSMTLPERGD